MCQILIHQAIELHLAGLGMIMSSLPNELNCLFTSIGWNNANNITVNASHSLRYPLPLMFNTLDPQGFSNLQFRLHIDEGKARLMFGLRAETFGYFEFHENSVAIADHAPSFKELEPEEDSGLELRNFFLDHSKRPIYSHVQAGQRKRLANNDELFLMASDSQNPLDALCRIRIETSGYPVIRFGRVSFIPMHDQTRILLHPRSLKEHSTTEIEQNVVGCLEIATDCPDEVSVFNGEFDFLGRLQLRADEILFQCPDGEEVIFETPNHGD